MQGKGGGKIGSKSWVFVCLSKNVWFCVDETPSSPKLVPKYCFFMFLITNTKMKDLSAIIAVFLTVEFLKYMKYAILAEKSVIFRRCLHIPKNPIILPKLK